MAHVQWCSERYRSYRPGNNSYRSYSGSQRECVSPFTSGSRTREEEEVDHADIGIDRPHARYAVEEGPASFLTPRHIASCFARYRSYSPENNSYQPYGGGSRQQCE
ncbi:BA14K family protein [Mesorhizobium sp. IMUNJ 23232]|uniref:BA14K family protein n=1 Tax=Mesorhizobium sp. IMUNJ 23232 TaxID=3376064 RepID=UPI0037A3EBF6